MKKIVVLSVISILFLTGCFNFKLNANKDNNIKETSYGTYKIDGLVERRDHSTADKLFYSLEKDKNNPRPDNVSVNMGTNYYTKSQHEMFRRAIQEQLYRQVGRNAKINGNGLTTTKGNFVYKFLITRDNDKTEITQYYIIGDYKYVLVYETNFSKNPDLDIASYNIVDTFEWK